MTAALTHDQCTGICELGSQRRSIVWVLRTVLCIAVVPRAKHTNSQCDWSWRDRRPMKTVITAGSLAPTAKWWAKALCLRSPHTPLAVPQGAGFTSSYVSQRAHTWPTGGAFTRNTSSLSF